MKRLIISETFFLILNEQAALATKWNEPPRDAIDTMILIGGLKLPQVCL
jgi:hypothetical protein